MSGTRGADDPLRQTQREVDGQRETSSPRNYEALRQTQQEVDARPTPTPQQTPAARNPYEDVDERLAAYSKSLEPEVRAGRITASDQVYKVNRYDNELQSEQIKYNRLAKAHELVDAVKAQKAQEQQKEIAQDLVPERDGAER